MPEQPRRDRAAFVLLGPSLIVPIIAMALAAWRDEHAYAYFPGMHVDPGFLFYTAAQLTLSAVFFSMCLNAVLALRQHADLERRAIPLRRLVPHFVVSTLVALWAVEFTLLPLAFEGVFFGVALAIASIKSLASVGSADRRDQQPISTEKLSRMPTPLLLAHPILAVAATAATVLGLHLDSDLYLVSLALLGVLGLPLSGAAVLLWFPLALVAIRLDRDGVPCLFLVLAGACALVVSALAICTAVSPSVSARILNRLLGRDSVAS